LAVFATAFVVLVLVPPLGPAARRFDWAEALQFIVLALVAPGLFVAAAPWDWVGLGHQSLVLAEARRRHPERLRSLVLVCPALACMVGWRLPAAVDRLHSGGWPLAVEAVSLVVAGTVLWLECVTSPPLIPRATRPMRIALCALSMWTIWVLAYLVAMSNGDWYRAYDSATAGGLRPAIDQQIAAGVMWAIAGACFIPLIFWNLLQWLRSEEDPDQELHRLVREERRRALPPHPTL
jgi:cytochrome c oxidase assembly factor CtaG